jgi:hypothetical protein
MNRSHILAKVGVREIGCKSVLISFKFFTFRIGITSAFFQIVGTNDCCMDAFNMDAIGKTSINELGTQSGPDDFEIEIVDNLR